MFGHVHRVTRSVCGKQARKQGHQRGLNAQCSTQAQGPQVCREIGCATLGAPEAAPAFAHEGRVEHGVTCCTEGQARLFDCEHGPVRVVPMPVSWPQHTSPLPGGTPFCKVSETSVLSTGPKGLRQPNTPSTQVEVCPHLPPCSCMENNCGKNIRMPHCRRACASSAARWEGLHHGQQRRRTVTHQPRSCVLTEAHLCAGMRLRAEAEQPADKPARNPPVC